MTTESGEYRDTKQESAVLLDREILKMEMDWDDTIPVGGNEVRDLDGGSMNFASGTMSHGSGVNEPVIKDCASDISSFWGIDPVKVFFQISEALS